MSTPSQHPWQPLHARKSRLQARLPLVLTLVALLSAAGALAIALHTYRQHLDAYLHESIGGIQTCAISLHEYDLGGLAAAPSDASSEAYRIIKTRLRHVYECNPKVVVVLVFRHNPRTGETLTLVNEPYPGTPDTLPPGSPVPPAIAQPQLLRALLADDEGVIAQFNRNAEYGDIREACAIAARRTASDGTTTADIAYYQIDAGSQLRSSIAAAAARALGVFLLAVLPMAAYLIARGNTRQRHALHGHMKAFDQCGDSIVIAGPKQHYLYANQGFVRISGYTVEELYKMKGWDFWPEKPPNAEEIWATLFAPGAEPYVHERMIVGKNRKYFWARISITPIHDKKDKNKIVASMHLCVDLSEASRRNRILDDARRRAEDAGRAKSAFIATMSHEVRTPLNSIIGFSNLLIETQLAPDPAACVAAIRQHGENLAQISSYILDISRLESGGRIKADECDINSLCLDALGAAETATGKRMRYGHDMHPDVPGILSVDIGRLNQLLVNLALGAAHHMQTGEVRLTLAKASADSSEHDAGHFPLQVRMTGRREGFPPPPEPTENAPVTTDETPVLWLILARRLAVLMDCKIINDRAGANHFAFAFVLRCRRAETPKPGVP